MKRLLCIIITFLYLNGVDAQPVIDANWVPAPGDNFVQRSATYSQLPYSLFGDTGLGLSGNNVTWDFSQLQLQNDYDTIRYTGTTDSLVRTDISSQLTLSWSGNELVEAGETFTHCDYSYHYEGIYYQFPMADTSVTTYLSASPAQGNDCFLNNSVQYLSWGKLLLPGNIQYNNVLMVEQSNGSGYVDYYNDGDEETNWPLNATNQETDSYQWIVAGISNPVLTVNVYLNTTTVYNWSGEPGESGMNSTTTADTSTRVWIYQSRFTTGITETPAPVPVQFKLYPNPSSMASVQCAVSSELIGSTLEIYDAEGRLVFNSKPETQNSKLDLNLASGVYIATLKSATGVQTQKLVVER